MGPVAAQELSEVVEWTDSLQLEDPEGVYTVEPQVRVDSSGFLVTDFEESQVRLYTRTGELKTSFGRKGSQAPGALQGPSAALRLASGRFLVPDILNGNISLFDAEGNFVERYERVVVRGNVVHEFPREGVLLIGSEESTPGSHPLLHRFDPESGTIENSFFPHPAPLGSYGNYLISVAEIATADVRADRIVAAFAIFDTLYFFRPDGTRLRTVDLQLSHFQELEKPNTEVKREDFEEVLTSHSSLTDVFWLNERTLLVQYRETVNLDEDRLRWNLAAVTPDGKVLFEIQDTPKLHAVDRDTEELYFDDPDHLAPNHWIVGRLKDLGTGSEPGE